MDERARTMHMLFPFRSVCESFVVLRPLGVISLQAGSANVLLGREERVDDVLLSNVFENHVWRKEEGCLGRL
jgi:hypothetical protein